MQDLCNILRCKGFYISPSNVSSNLYYHIRCVCSSMPKLPKIKNLGAFNVYVIMKWPKFRPLHHPCYTCLILLHPICEGSELYVKHSPPPITKIVNGVVFLFHNHQLESALINVRKKCSPDLKVSHVSLDTILQLPVQIRTYKYQKKYLKQLETMLLPILSKFKAID